MDEPREMVCSECYRAFTVQAMSWREAEAKRCPYCHGTDTTPMLEVRIGSKRLRHYSIGFKPDSEIRRAGS